MASSAILVAKRAFVSVLLALGCAYRLAFTINRDSDDADILRAYRRTLLKVHPDKGVRKADMQKLQDAKEQFDKARATSGGKAGRPKTKAKADDDTVGMVGTARRNPTAA